MLISNPRSNSHFKIPPKIADKVGKIKNILSQAMGEVHTSSLILKKTNSYSPSKRRSDQSSESQSIHEVLSNLRRGYLMAKHCENRNQAHSKFIYLSEDGQYICWKSLQKQDEKRMELCQITKVVKQGALYYIKSSKIRDINCCIVIIGDKRNLQLEAGSEIQAQYLKYQLERAIKYSKCMKFNYKYRKNQ